MAAATAEMRKIVAYVAKHFDRDLSLDALAAHAGFSRFHLHRVFLRTAGETPARFATRLRLGRAAVMLLTTGESILDIALACGFENHETFCRAFRKRFQVSPRNYRARGFAQRIGEPAAKRHAQLVAAIGPCVGLYGKKLRIESRDQALPYAVSKKQIEPEPVLIISRRVKRSEIPATIAESLGAIFGYAQAQGVALTGLPFTRYMEMGPGLVSMQPGMRIAPGGPAPVATDAGGVTADMLPGGLVATTLHTGPYEGLPDAYAAIEQWIEAEGLATGGAPWESYVNDPSHHPDPAEWKTEIFWPLSSQGS